MEILGNDLGAKKGKKGQLFFECEMCDFKCSKKYSWERHILTPKHVNGNDGNGLEIKKGKKGQKYLCDHCNCYFVTNSGLWKHRQKCVGDHPPSKAAEQSLEDKAKHITDKDELIMFLIKENTEFKNIILEQQTMMMKVIENGTHNTTNNTTHTNSHNKAFNLNFFLNETCKNAMNITDFVDSIKLQLSDLERVGEIGYVQGISEIITSNLKAMDITLRPVHCTDKKRETMYIKDNNEWKKEEETKPNLRKAIKRIEDKNLRLIPQYRAKYPDYNDTSSTRVDKYDKLVLEALGGVGDENEKLDKIIRNISNATTIDK